jgi:hypothetical protein
VAGLALSVELKAKRPQRQMLNTIKCFVKPQDGERMCLFPD